MTLNPAGTSPIARRVRAYVAPVDRATATPTIFDPAQQGSFSLDAPPSPWIDLGWCTNVTRNSGTRIDALRTGVPAIATSQVRTAVEATLAMEFQTWGKLQLALASGSQQMNLLATAAGAASCGSGGTATAAVDLGTGSTANSLNVGVTSAPNFSEGDLVSVDLDYTGQTGFIGSWASAGYVKQASDIGSDVNYVRRVSLNVGRVRKIAAGYLQLEAALPAGAPTAAMKVSRVLGFVDREGGNFFQEWSAFFCMPGEQGDRVMYYYPRLQPLQGPAETVETLSGPLERIKLAAAFRALPVVDANDGAAVVCFRSYLPG